MNANDGSGNHTWNYQYTLNTNGTGTTTVTDPLGNDKVYSFTNMSVIPRQTQSQAFQGSHSAGTLLQTIQTAWTDSSGRSPCGSAGCFPTKVTTIWPNGKQKQIQKDYGSSGQVLSQREYDYGPNAPGALLRTTTTTYLSLSNSSYAANNLLDLFSQVSVFAGASASGACGANGAIACTSYGYDETTLGSSGITTQHDSAPPAGTYRGNQTSVNRWLNLGNKLLTAKRVFYDTGTVETSTDPSGNTTTYTYDASTLAGAFVTKTQAPDTNSPVTHHITQDWFDFNTGLKTSHTDENSNPTTYSYDDMLRIETITPPAPQGAITFTYTDTPGSLSVERQRSIGGGQSATEYDLFDGFGRMVSHVVANGQATPYDKTDTCYESRGLKSFVSYPYQTSTWNSWPTCPISQVGDSYAYDALKRTTSVTHSDSTAITSTHTGRATSVADEGNGTRSVQKVSQVDGLERLTSVCEVTSTSLAVGADHVPGACGQDIAATGFLTTYTYDALGNITSVSQGSSLNQRTFTYDSLSRLITTTNPESGTTCFGTWSGSTCVENYDANGNALSRTRPAPNQSSSTTYVTTTYQYDALNRLTQKSYSDGVTLPALFGYDQSSISMRGQQFTITNSIGRLSWTCVLQSTFCLTDSAFSYDAVGNIILDFQGPPGNSGFTFNYGYDGMGDVTSSNNGNGITYTLSYSVAQRLTQIATNWISTTISSGNLISSVQYNAFGEPSSTSLYSGINESWGYDARGRMQSYAAGTKYTVSNVTYSGNSNIRSATDSVNGTWSAYAYDDFNRLVSSSCTAGCPGTGNQNGLAFSYVYDRYGNRWQQNMTVGSIGPQPQYSFDANNRIIGFTLDAAGNITNDSVHSYTYDAENRIVQVDGGNTGVYTYDAEGRRAAKTAGGASYNYLFDLGGRAVTELIAGTTTTNRAEVYAGGRHLATQNFGTTYFIHSDWLGTERVRTGLTGTTIETCISLAYGDSLTCTGTDVSPLHFTGKMHDNETGLDDFPARYYSSTQGRWYSPDWASAQVPVPYADLHNPQTLNLYDYVGSNPTNHSDADGHTQGQDELTSMWVFDPANNLALGTFRTTTAQGADQSDETGSQTGCEAQMRSRPGDITTVKGHGASHAWWWVVTGTGQDYTLSFTGKVTWQVVPTTAGPVPVPVPVLNAYYALGAQSSSNKNDNLQNGVVIFDAVGPGVCAGVSKMIQATKSFPVDLVPYGPVEGTATSNSGARYLGAVGGFNPPMPNQPGLRAVGWDLRIPGIEQ
jgi:RHS repeat-associated protein